MNANWKADCPKCAASKFTCDQHHAPEIECPDCNGHGEVCGVNPNRRSRFVGQDDLSPDDFTAPCEACNGHGWRAMTQDEIDDAAADAFSDMCEGEPPVTMQEQHQAAWLQHRELHR